MNVPRCARYDAVALVLFAWLSLMMKKEDNPTKKAMSGSPGKVLTSAVRHGRGNPAVLLVGLHKALEGGLGFLATKGLLRLACFPADAALRRKHNVWILALALNTPHKNK